MNLQSQRLARVNRAPLPHGVEGLCVQLQRNLSKKGYQTQYLVPRVSLLRLISGEQPRLSRTRVGRAKWRLRVGDPVGAWVSLQGRAAWSFLERSRGHLTWSPGCFDVRGNLGRVVPRVGLLPCVEAHYQHLRAVEGLPLQVRVEMPGSSREGRIRSLRRRGFSREAQGV